MDAQSTSELHPAHVALSRMVQGAMQREAMLQTRIVELEAEMAALQAEVAHLTAQLPANATGAHSS